MKLDARPLNELMPTTSYTDDSVLLAVEVSRNIVWGHIIEGVSQGVTVGGPRGHCHIGSVMSQCVTTSSGRQWRNYRGLTHQ